MRSCFDGCVVLWEVLLACGLVLVPGSHLIKKLSGHVAADCTESAGMDVFVVVESDVIVVVVVVEGGESAVAVVVESRDSTVVAVVGSVDGAVVSVGGPEVKYCDRAAAG